MNGRRETGLVVGAHGLTVDRDVRDDVWVALDDDPLFPVGRFRSGRRSVAWPGALLSRLPDLGPTRVGLVEVSGGPTIRETQHDFGGRQAWERPTDAWGRGLTLNKWGWFGLQLADRSPSELRRALVDAKAVISELGAASRPAWVVGGTLLGAVRAQELIGHDDDVDIAYLATSSEPDEVALESFALERRFVAAGWESRRFSGAHFQLEGPPVEGRAAVHVDVFSAFFRHGFMNQPFHVRGRLREEQLLPLGEVEISGIRFPAPRNVTAWLRLNYGPSWRTPQPGHVLRTPRSTQLRFSAWFGQYLDGFEYWNDAHDRSQAPDPQVSDSARWVAKYLPTGTAVLELGCGSGADARFLASCGFPVLATDFLTCPPGLLEFPEAGVSFVRMDIADPRGLMYLAELAKGLDRPPHIYARHVLDNGLGAWTRREVMGALAGFPDGTSLSVAVRLVEPSRRPGGSEPRGAISWPAFWEPSQRSGIEWVCVAEELGPTSTTLLWGRRTPGGSWWRRLPRSLDGLKSGCLGLSRYALRRAESLDARRAADAHSQPRGGPS